MAVNNDDIVSSSPALTAAMALREGWRRPVFSNEMNRADTSERAIEELLEMKCGKPRTFVALSLLCTGWGRVAVPVNRK